MNEKELTPDEGLHIIQGMIAMAKNKIRETGFHFLLWGTLVIVASLLNYAALINGNSVSIGYIWLSIMLIGIVAAFAYEYFRIKNGASVPSYFDKMYNSLWMAHGFAVFTVLFLCSAIRTSPVPFILLVAGLSTFASGLFYRYYPLLFGGFACWIGAVVASLVHDERQLIVNAIAIFFGFIIPGVYLWKKNRSSK